MQQIRHSHVISRFFVDRYLGFNPNLDILPKPVEKRKSAVCSMTPAFSRSEFDVKHGSETSISDARMVAPRFCHNYLDYGLGAVGQGTAAETPDRDER
jgi:hypothetical protein